MPVTTPNESAVPIIPDFAADARTVAAFDAAWTSYQNRLLHEAEERLRSEFTKQRSVIRAEIATAGALLIDKKFKADRAFKTYAYRYPHRIHQGRAFKPSFWDQLFSFGMAGWMYRRTITTAADVVEAQSQRERKENEEVELEQRLQRDLIAQEESLKKSFHTDEGIAAFHAVPGIAEMHQHVTEIQAERERYAARLADADVSPIEQRDREFAEHNIQQLQIPSAGVAIVRLARYDDFTYFILRDLKGNLFRVAYDPRLEPLVHVVFDLYRYMNTAYVRLSPGVGGLPTSLADHYAANFPDRLDAHAKRREERAALDVPRGDVPPMVFHVTLDDETNEQDMVELLATFAQSLLSVEVEPPAGEEL